MSHPTIVVAKGNARYKLCKVWFGKDGSVYITVPYHPARKAVFMKQTADLTAGGQFWPSGQELELASLEDDDARPKLSLHPDGFCQFSGKGIISGIGEDGKAKGIGVFSSPFANVGRGPRFSIVVQGIEVFEKHEKPQKEDIVFDHEQLYAPAHVNGLALDGHYFQPPYRRFIRTLKDGSKYLMIPHPCGAILPLLVLLPPDNCEIPGVLGLELYAVPTSFPEPTFSLSGPGENARKDERGHNLADVIVSVFPPPASAQKGRDLQFNPLTK